MSAEYSNVNPAGIRPPLHPILVGHRHPSLSGLTGLSKRLFDVLFATVGLLLTLPLMVIIGLLIKLDSPGPVFFRQVRVGLNGQEFPMFKFRSMVVDAEQQFEALKAHNEIPDGVIFKMGHDPRITRLGRFLRRSSLDELPQLFNVLRGDMSLIGPRPPLPEEVLQYATPQLQRLSVMPGCTGLWQVSARGGQTTFHQMVELDLEYIRSWSLRLDLRILLKTVTAVVNLEGR